MSNNRDLELLGAEERGRRKGFGQGLAAAKTKGITGAEPTDADIDKAVELVREMAADEIKAAAMHGFFIGYLMGGHKGMRPDEIPEEDVDAAKQMAEKWYAAKPATEP